LAGIPVRRAAGTEDHQDIPIAMKLQVTAKQTKGGVEVYGKVINTYKSEIVVHMVTIPFLKMKFVWWYLVVSVGNKP